MSSSSTNTAVTTIVALAAASAVSLSLLQTDAASRAFLSPKKLQLKRVREYLHRWDWSLKKALLYARNGNDQQMDKDNTLVYFEEDDIADFIGSTLVNKMDNSVICVMTIEVDDADFEYYVYLKNENNGMIYQLPLIKFGLLLKEAFENQVTTATMCFVADASSGLGSEVLTTVLQESKAGVTLVKEPLWLALFAHLVEKQVFGKDQLQQVLFALCRLDAWRVRNDLGSAQTVVFTLPGQACTPSLIPLLQAVFPCERHLFAYDACIPSVERALYWRRNNSSTTFDSLEFHNSITATTPLSSTSLTACIRTLADSLSKLPISLADTVETWMSSVNAFLEMKENEATNDYLPYVLKLSLIVNDESLQDTDGNKRRLALTNVLQFITGSRSRPLPQGVIDAAVESLRDVTSKLPILPSLSKKQCELVEDCVFQHKSILIENKTLMDTVMPQKEWTLKAAKKISGCACCAPDPDDMPEESSVAKKERASRARPKYVDGKMGFAFDPTQFG